MSSSGFVIIIWSIAFFEFTVIRVGTFIVISKSKELIKLRNCSFSQDSTRKSMLKSPHTNNGFKRAIDDFDKCYL